jgi:hypothetical protein
MVYYFLSIVIIYDKPELQVHKKSAEIRYPAQPSPARGITTQLNLVMAGYAGLLGQTRAL